MQEELPSLPLVLLCTTFVATTPGAPRANLYSPHSSPLTPSTAANLFTAQNLFTLTLTPNPDQQALLMRHSAHSRQGGRGCGGYDALAHPRPRAWA